MSLDMTSRSQPSLRPRSENLPLRLAVQEAVACRGFEQRASYDLFLDSGLSLELILETVETPPPSSGLIHRFTGKDILENAFH